MADILYLQDVDGENSNDDIESDMQQNYLEPGSTSSNQYEFLPPLLRLEKHAFSANTFHRQLVGRLILETLPSVADNPVDVATVMAVALKVADDTDAPVRAELMEQVPHITMLCHEDRERLHYVIEENLLPLVVKFLSDSDSQVRKMSQAALLVMMEQGLLEEAAIEQVVCPVVLRLTELERQVEYYTGAIVLMGKMAPLLGKAKTKELFVTRFAALCTDPVFFVRKACAANIGEICAVLGMQATEELLLDAFLGLCRDEVWGVRKACAEVFLSVACTCSMHTRRHSLTPAFSELLADTSRWVRMAAFCVLGPFVSTFAEPPVTGLAYNHLRELVLVNPHGAEFRFCTSKGGDGDIMVKYLDGNPPYNINYKYNFADDNQSLDLDNAYTSKQSVSASSSISVISKECEDLVAASVESNFSNYIDSTETNNDEGDKTGVGGTFEDAKDEENKENVSQVSIELEFPAPDSVDSMSGIEFEDQLDVRDCTSIPYVEDEPSDMSSNKSMPIKNSLEENSLENRISNYVECDNHVKRNIALKDILPSHEELDTISHSDDNTPIDDQSQTNKRRRARRRINEEVTAECQVHARNCVDNYNTFQYWRVPIPEISLEPEPPTSTTTTIYKNDDMEIDTELDNLPGLIYKNDDMEIDTELDNLPGLIETISIGKSTGQYSYMITARKANTHQTNSHAVSITTVPESISHNTNVRGTHPITKNEKGKSRHREQNVIPQGLLDSFLSMTHPSQAQATDNEIAHHCAFSFPAVAHTLGRAHWPLLKFAYEALASDMQWKVRRTVASSIHELAWILGEELAAKDLVPIFNGFIKDLDEVRIGALKHLSDFLKVLQREQRDSYLPRLSEFLLTDNEWNWRFRAALAEQLSLSVQLFSPSDARKYLAPLATNLLLDKVSAVRQMALALVCGLVCRSSSEPILLRNLLAEVAEQFAHSKRWGRRQVFVLLCSRLIALDALPHEEFARNVLPHLLDLSWDPVANVRLAVARTLATTILHHRYFSSEESQHSDLLLQILKRLQNDIDRDVRFFASSASQLKWVYEASSSKKILLPVPPSGEGPCIRH